MASIGYWDLEFFVFAGEVIATAVGAVFAGALGVGAYAAIYARRCGSVGVKARVTVRAVAMRWMVGVRRGWVIGGGGGVGNGAGLLLLLLLLLLLGDEGGGSSSSLLEFALVG